LLRHDLITVEPYFGNFPNEYWFHQNEMLSALAKVFGMIPSEVAVHILVNFKLLDVLKKRYFYTVQGWFFNPIQSRILL
jgi:hypothetical protein